MKNWAGEILDTFEEYIDRLNFRGVKICTVKSINPFVFTYNGIEIGTKLNDTVYIHPLLTSPLIELDTETIKQSQNFTNTTAYNSPNFTGIIEGSIPDFLKSFYEFFKNWQSIYILNPNDLIAVYELGNNQYLVLSKVAKDILQKEETEGENEL